MTSVALELSGGTVESVTLEYVLSLDLSNGWHLDIESAATLTVAGISTVIAPARNEQLAEVLDAVLGRTVTACAVEPRGALLLHLDGGQALTVEPDDSFEAWTAAGPAGEKYVCEPGGSVAWWSPTDE